VLALVVAPLLALGGVLLGHALARRSAREVEVRWQREETMRMLRWAADHAAGDGRARGIGVEALRGLSRSALLKPDDLDLVSAVLLEAQR
jgi:hypothetical protein